MHVFWVTIAGILLTILLAFWFKSDQSRYEINRQAEHSKKYRNLASFLDIYPGIRVLTHLFALVVGIWLSGLAIAQWGEIGGGLVAFLVVLVSWIISRALRSVSSRLITKNLDFLNKYLGWAGIFSRLINVGNEPQITSEQELLFLIDSGDFLDDSTKTLMKNSLSLRDKSVKDLLTPREQIAFVRSRDHLTPKMLDELFESGHKIFPVVEVDLDHMVGFLYLDDVLPLEQEEKSLPKTMRKAPPSIDVNAPLESALAQMAEYHTSVLIADNDGKVAGMITLSAINKQIFQSYSL